MCAYNKVMARPRQIDGARRVAVFLSARDHAIARALGEGNVSEGVRAALMAEDQRRAAAKSIQSLKGNTGDGLLAALGVRKASDL